MARRDNQLPAIKLQRIGKRTFDSFLNSELVEISGHPVSISPLWQIPSDDTTDEYQICSSFGSIYAGESCTMRLRVTNQSSTAVIQNIRLTCSIQRTNVQTFPLLFECLIDLLPQEDHKNFAFTLVVGVPDTYFLNFQMHYQVNEIPEPSIMRKLNRFDAKSALKYETDVVRKDDYIAVRCRLGNTSINSISLKNVNFSPSPSFAVEPLFQGLFLTDNFKPGEVRSLLFKLNELRPPSLNEELGRLLVTWWNETGDLGHATFKGVDIPPKLDNMVSWTLDTNTKTLVVEKPSYLVLHIRNNSKDIMLEDAKLVLLETEMRGVLLSAVNSLIIGAIEPQSEKTIELLAFPCIAGLQVLSGLHLFVRGKKVSTSELQVYIKY